MKVERLQEYFTVFCITAAGVLSGVYCAQLAGQGNLVKLGYIAAIIAVLIISLAMKSRIWLLIPFTWNLGGQTYLIPIPFSVHDLSIMLSFGLFLIFTAFKLIRKKPKNNFGDFLMWLNILYLATAYVRNPVGINSFGNERVGGKPYFLVMSALMGYWVLTRVTVTGKVARFLPIAILIGSGVVAVLSLVAYKVPATVPVLSHIYSGIEQSSYVQGQGNFAEDASADPDSMSGRIGTMLDFGLVAVSILCAFYAPVTLLNPLVLWRFLAFIIAWAAILSSGHRVGIIVAFSIILISSYFRRGWLELFRLTAFFVPVLMVLLMGQGSLFELPMTAQRALSILPGKWNRAAVQSAKDSTDWRLQMWDKVLHSNKYIKDKILGDGFGTSQKAQDEIIKMMDAGQVEEAGMEGQLINGGFHNGPLSTIRTVGVVGLVFFYMWMIYLASYAVKLIRFSQGTPFFPTALFFGGSMLFRPFLYTFIFGAFEADLPTMILTAGMLRLLYQSVEAYKESRAGESAAESTRRPGALHEFVPASA